MVQAGRGPLPSTLVSESFTVVNQLLPSFTQDLSCKPSLGGKGTFKHPYVYNKPSFSKSNTLQLLQIWYSTLHQRNHNSSTQFFLQRQADVTRRVSDFDIISSMKTCCPACVKASERLTFALGPADQRHHGLSEDSVEPVPHPLLLIVATFPDV